MAKVLILSSNAEAVFDVWRHSSAFLLKHSAELDPFGEHSLIEDPAEADIILFAEMGTIGKFAERVRAHPYYRRYAEKCFVFDSGDYFFPVVPGIYASLTREQYREGHLRTGFYLYMIENPFIVPRPLTGNEKYLASFVGSRSHVVREKIFRFGRSNIYVKDTSEYSNRVTYNGEPAERACFWAEYADSMADARFSLCPRGAGASSIRLFESMKMGRACVILSDAWQPNDDVEWSEFSIIVAERDVARVPEILDQNAHRAAEMGARARRVWEEQFSERVRFHRVVELCLDIRRQGGIGIATRRLRMLLQIANPKKLRWYLQSKKNLYLDTGKILW
jgi:hypothetical protein